MSLWQAVLRLLVALGCGAAIGLERERGDRPAGFRTTILVSVGAALFTLLSLSAFEGSDPARVAAQVVVGIGFLGAGVIILYGGTVIRGITTAAALWASAAVGMAAGTGRFALAGLATALVFIVLTLFNLLEDLLISRITTRQFYLTVETEGGVEQVPGIRECLSGMGVRSEVIRMEECREGVCRSSLVFRIKAPQRLQAQEIVSMLMKMENVLSALMEE